MPTQNLTDRTLRSLSTDKAQEEFWDGAFQGAAFGVRVSGATESKRFILRYSLAGKRRRMTLGSYPDLALSAARERARELVVAIDSGRDPLRELKACREAPTFGQLASLYMERHAKPNKRSWQYDQQQLNHDLLPAWGDKKARDIDRADVLSLLDTIVDRGSPYMANRTRSLISTMFNFGITRGLVVTNPATHVRSPIKPRARQRVLTEEEIHTLWRALDRLTPVMAGTFKLRLLTAQRGVEVLSMRHENLNGGWWTIPENVSKNGLTHRVPLSSQAIGILTTMQPMSHGSPWVFPSRKGAGHIRWVQKATRELRKETTFDWIPHDLRRTAATFMTGELGVPRLVVGKILNHAEPGVTAVYDRSSYDAEKRQALVAWGHRVEQIVTGKPAGDKIVGRIG